MENILTFKKAMEFLQAQCSNVEFGSAGKLHSIVCTQGEKILFETTLNEDDWEKCHVPAMWRDYKVNLMRSRLSKLAYHSIFKRVQQNNNHMIQVLEARRDRVKILHQLALEDNNHPKALQARHLLGIINSQLAKAYLPK